jgi:Co/Zn/Cd efflux system component
MALGTVTAAKTQVRIAAEIVGGLLFGSIALVADGLHMSTHATTISRMERRRMSAD